MSAIQKKVYFKVQKPDTWELLPVDTFPAGWRFKELSSRQERQFFYDTFEWQAFEKEAVIVKKKNTLYLLSLTSGHEKASVTLQGNPSSFFSDDLPCSKTKEELSSYSDIRAFIRLCSIDVRIRTYCIINDEGKTTGTLTSESLSLSDKSKQDAFMHLVSLQPLKGYQKEMSAFEQSLSSFDETMCIIEFSTRFLFIMSAAGLNVQGYSSKIRLHFNADAPVHESARLLLQCTLSIMRLNETGISKNIDTEFLHDYRVAVRRTRSILKQLKGVFGPQEIKYYLNAVKEIGKRTNELRDRDVCLLRQPAYCRYLPPFLQPSLKTFFSEIAISRTALHKQVCRYFVSEDYRSLLEEWKLFINCQLLPDPEQAPNASLSTRAIVLTSIKKAWKKAIRHGRQIGQEATDSELHTLRIDCKKLRYLLEFFSSIFPDKTITPVIRQLKELQENLGNFVDYAVQIHFLYEHLASAKTCSGDKFLAASIGGLMTTLYQKQEEARQKFHKSFREFDNDETTRLFHELLTNPN
jgi:CHAD domain-containing protein